MLSALSFAKDTVCLQTTFLFGAIAGRQVCIFRPGTALGFNKIPLSIFATRSEGWAHSDCDTAQVENERRKCNQKEMSILTCGDNVINRNVQFDDLILILFIYSNFDDLILILVIFLILMILF